MRFDMTQMVLRLACLVMLATTAASAQTPVAVLAGAGATGGVGIESAELAVYDGAGECGTFESGSSTLGAIDGRLVLPFFFGDAVGLDARLRIGLASARLTATPPAPTTVRDGGELVTLEREFRLDRTTISTSLDLLARVAAGPVLLGAGASLGARVSSTFEQTDNILGPGDNAFSDGQTSLAMSSGAKESAAFIVAPMLVAGLPIATGARTTLVPELSMRLDLLSSMKEGSWRSVELGLGVAVLFDLTPGASPIVPGK